MKSSILFFLSLLFAFSFHSLAQTKQLSKPLLIEFGERFKIMYENNYYFKVFTNTSLRKQGKSFTVEEIDNIIERFGIDVKSQDIIFKTIYDRGGGNDQIIYALLRDMGLSASKSSLIKNYIIEKVSAQIKKERLTEENVTEQSKQNSTNHISENRDWSINGVPKLLSQVQFKNNSFKNQVLNSDNINKSFILKKLFPGNYYENDNGEYTVWSCPDYPKCHFDSINSYELPEEFPYKEANFTKVSGICKYQVEGIEYCAVTFSTSNCYPPSVYTMPGILGVSIFKKIGVNWRLIFYDPFAAALGTYQYAGNISKTINLGKGNVGYCMSYGDGGHGSNTSYASMQMFKIDHDKYKKILSVSDYGFSKYNENDDIQFELTSELVVLNSSDSLSEINLIQKGLVNQTKLSEEKKPELEEYSSKYKKYSFVINKTYKYDGNSYVLSNLKTSAVEKQ